MSDIVEIEGYVERITFHNEENGYTVLFLVDEDGEEECVVGNFSYIAEGLYLHVEGREVIHKSYGPQIQVESYEEKQPSDSIAVERYLGSGAIKGVGPALAGRIVAKFGTDTFDVMEREPERLAEVKGISMKSAIRIAEQFNENRQMRKAMLFLQEYGVSTNLAVKIFKYYGEDMYEVLRTNPYKLAEDIGGIGFKIADNIARQGGFLIDSAFRVQAGILYALQQSGSRGHCYLPEEELVQESAHLLGVSEQIVTEELEGMMLNKELIIKELPEGRCLYSSTLYYTELNCARMLLDLNLPYKVNEEKLHKQIHTIEGRDGIVLDDTQRNAVIQSMRNGVTIITGGPGTGKTTTINTILQLFQSEDLEVLMAAPTGRAAKRMSESSGQEAQTIHRLLEVTGGTVDGDERGSLHFERNEKQPLEADVIIVDEFSMVDIHLLYALLRAIVPGTRLIMVGDVNQLPSVGPGNVLKDMIRSQFCTVVRLQHIFRQAAKSQIVVNAHKINAGEGIDLSVMHPDFLHLEREDSNAVIGVVLQMIMEKLPPHVGAKPSEIQVLTPMRKGELGVENLNKVLQRFVNPESPDKLEREFHGVLFREQDKVMQIKNNYQIKWEKRNRFGDVYEEGTGVFNGDTGVIRDISNIEETVTVEYDEKRMVKYEFSQMDEMELAYAITIHKSQGSEYPAVVLPLLGGPALLMNRNLLYTAVTRAKHCVASVGSGGMIGKMIQNVNEQKRYSSLCLRIQEMKGEEEYFS